mmetsp:Transcript_99668/g.197585  ORF Transcript_99668/g.197585 Transcript_99668/m.197585 type:complete len:320 (+) Transcript_99668:126-1085(+)
MACVHEPLLTSSESKSSQATEACVVPARKWTRAVAALTATGAILLFTCFALRRSEPKSLFDKLGTRLWGENLQYNDPRCMQNTGGTCNIWSCHADRGPTTCTWWYWGHRCLCKEGYCASEIGRCSKIPTSIQINHTFVLRNVQWPEYHLQIQSGGYSVVVDDGDVDEWSKFRLFQMPVAKGMRPTLFMLGSVAYPDYLVETSADQVCETHCNSYATDKNGHQTCTDSYETCHMEYSAMVGWIFKPVREQKLRFYQANWQEPAFLIEGVSTPNRFWYIPQFSYTLDVSQPGDPGPQGYWTADPPFPDGLLVPPMAWNYPR